MQVEYLIQNGKENSLVNSLVESFSKKPKKVYMFLGDLKEAGFRLIEEEFIDTNIKLFMAVGVNKKHTTRSMLDSILEYTKDAYYYTNNDIIEFDSNICIFEYTNEAIMYTSSSSFSESGISENISIYNKVTVDLKDQSQKTQYKKIVKELTKTLEELRFIKLTKQKINELVENKEIFSTRQYTHTNVKSISELLGKSDKDMQPQTQTDKNDIDDVFLGDIEIPKVDLSDIDISDIDLSEELKKENKKEVKEPQNDVEVEYNDIQETTIQPLQEYSDEIEEQDDVIDKNNELYDESLEKMDFDQDSVIDINDMLFSKADVKLDVDIKNQKRLKSEDIDINNNEFEDEEVLQVKKLNLNNVSNVIMELPNKPTKTQELVNIKIPNHLQKMIPDFFELQDKGKSIDINGVTYKQRDIKLEIIDVKSDNKYNDRDAKILQKKGQSYLTITSEVIKNIDYTEKDIARIIKLSSDIYHIEIISKDMKEYKLWNKLCTQSFKSSTRKFGIM